MNLVLLEPGEVAPGGRVSLSDHRARHIAAVLKAAPAQHLRVGVTDGPLGTGTVRFISDNAVELDCTFEADAPPRPAVDLLLALPRPKVMRRLWAQLAALGVGRILLTNAEKVERNYFDTHVLEPNVYRPLLIEGLQQARDTRVPEVTIHRQLKILVEDQLDAMTGDAVRLIADPGASTAIADAIPPAEPRRVLLAVGPEGGWNDFELRLLAKHRFQPVAMGPRTLRTDTACIALLALVHETLRLTTMPRPGGPHNGPVDT